MVNSTRSSSPTISPRSSEPASAAMKAEDALDVQLNLHAGRRHSRRWILASALIATLAVIGLLGTMTLRDRDSSRSEVASASPSAAHTEDRTLAELNQIWAAADAGSLRWEPPAAAAHVPAYPTAATDAALWAGIDYTTLLPGR